METGDPDETTARRWAPLRTMRLVLGLVGFALALVAIRNTRTEIGWDSELAVAPLVAAVLLAVVATAMAARAWSAILPGEGSRRYRRIYYSATIGKYVPGGVFQAAGQISLASETGLGTARAVSSYLVSIAIAVTSGLVSCVGLVLVPGFPMLHRGLAAVALVMGVTLASSGLMKSFAGWIGSVIRREILANAVPARRSILKATIWNVSGLAVFGLGFAVVLRGFVPGAPILLAVAAFPVSWLVGFLAIPFPAGIGVREAVLVALLATNVGTAAIIAASLVNRLAVIVAEVILFAFAQFRKHGPS